ncbi:hypothetical protein SASPL_118121 [Salvia splendens]|uniref:Dirigent protein n=1 Tax=Salvia splendens TaxID=180675 RepID=A0A8X8XYT9_SALSN|nr:dirigent protein 1-like [Salvia splendens]KAG6421564.1 hypothetical protein SASPL_118121 [Salvia splendens]
MCVYATRQDTNILGFGKQKLVKLHFFVHDLTVNHPNTTTYDVAQASITANSPTGFGTVRVVDDLITEDSDASSRPLARMQGMVAKSGLTTLAITMNVNIIFTEGQFAGSTLTILGRNEMSNATRELVVAGGTGVFRFASGYAIQSTHSFGFEVVVLEYYVLTTYSPKIINIDHVELAQM